jgi:hypothetical protein
MTTPAHDEAGNVIPIDPCSTVGQLVQLLEYCRAKDYRIGPVVRIDGLAVQIEDLRQSRNFGAQPMPDEGPWKAVGYDPDKEGG